MGTERQCFLGNIILYLSLYQKTTEEFSALMNNVWVDKVGEVCYYVFGFPRLLFWCLWRDTWKPSSTSQPIVVFFSKMSPVWLIGFLSTRGKSVRVGFCRFCSVCSLRCSTLLNCLIPALYFMGRHFSNINKLHVFHLQKEISKLITFEQGKTLADAEGDVFRGLRKLLAPPVKKGALRTHRKWGGLLSNWLLWESVHVVPFITSSWKERGNCNSNSSLRVSLNHFHVVRSFLFLRVSTNCCEGIRISCLCSDV